MAQSGASGVERQSADGMWHEVAESSVQPREERKIVPELYRVMALDRVALKTRLQGAPLESAHDVRTSPTTLSIPLPYGRFGRFRVVESPIMEPALAARHPDLHTYLGVGIDDPSATMRFDVTPQGFHAQILSAEGTQYVDPYQGGDADNYIAYAKEDYVRSDAGLRQCTVREPEKKPPVSNSQPQPNAASGANLRTFRLALSATGEYTQVHGGTVNGALSGMVSTMNRVNGIYEHDLAIRMVLVADTDKVIYLDPNTDPYTNNNGSLLLEENQTNLDRVIGNANYDIGHIFSTGGGGIASLGSVCEETIKGQGVTGSSQPDSDGYDIDYVAHEMGHQFGADHTFNSTASSCGGGNRSSAHAFETGSGVTVMAYAGICGTEDLQPHSEDFFHRGSLDEIQAYIATQPSCGITTPTGNAIPVVTAAAASFNIPARTPFTLTASGSDADGDPLTYVWEEMDLGASTSNATLTDNGARPLFRPFDPTTQPVRTFPSLRFILNNANVVPSKSPLPGTTTPNYYNGELLPTSSRTMKFRVTARDNHPGGSATNDAGTNVVVTSTAGPFQVTAPNTAVSWNAGDPETITWNVANTTGAPINTANVRITLSLDGGYTWPVELAASVPNSGTANVTLPANTPSTAQARVRVEAVGNIFFDISDANFSIVNGGGAAPIIVTTGSVTTSQGAPSVTGNVATVSGPGTITIAASGAPPELGVSVLNNAGTISLTATASCTLVSPTTGTKAYPILLTATSSNGGVASAFVNVNVGANARPTLGAYANQSLIQGDSAAVPTSAAPTDANNNYAGDFSVSPTTLPGGGTVSIDASGTVTVQTTASTLPGDHKIRAFATDVCGGSAVRQFVTTVKTTQPILSLAGTALPDGNNLVEPNECNSATLTLSNSPYTTATATAISGSLTTTTPGVTITQVSSPYPNLAGGASGANTQSYQISTDNTVACYTNIALTQTVSYAESGTPKVFNFSVPVGRVAPGYVFTASTGASITSTGTKVTGSDQDDAVVTVTAPFDVTVYGTTIAAGSAFAVSTNGNIQLAASGSDDWANASLPRDAQAQATGNFPASAPTIFAFWDDLDLSAAGNGIFTETTGAAPNRSFKVEWRGVTLGGGVNVDFAVYFHEGSNLFDIVYANDASADGDGHVATIGVQSATTGTLFTQYSLNSPAVTPGTRLTTSLPPAVCTAGTGMCAVDNDRIFANGFESTP